MFNLSLYSRRHDQSGHGGAADFMASERPFGSWIRALQLPSRSLQTERPLLLLLLLLLLLVEMLGARVSNLLCGVCNVATHALPLYPLSPLFCRCRSLISHLMPFFLCLTPLDVNFGVCVQMWQ
jgi:hypothetical protein